MRIILTALLVSLLSTQALAEKRACNADTTGLKYTKLEGSGLASLFFLPFLVAMAPAALATASNDQYKCHLAVLSHDAVTLPKPKGN